MFDWLKSLISESGTVSSMRIMFLFCVFLFVPTFLFLWIKFSLQAGQLQDIPNGVMWFLGILLAGKVSQKAIE